MSCGGTTRGNANAKCISEEVKSLNKRLKKRGTKRRATVALGQQEFHKLVAEEKKERGLAAGSHTDQDEIEALARQHLPQRLEEIMNDKIFADRDAEYEAEQAAEEQQSLREVQVTREQNAREQATRNEELKEEAAQDLAERYARSIAERSEEAARRKEIDETIARDRTELNLANRAAYEEKEFNRIQAEKEYDQERREAKAQWQKDYEEKTLQQHAEAKTLEAKERKLAHFAETTAHEQGQGPLHEALNRVTVSNNTEEERNLRDWDFLLAREDKRRQANKKNDEKRLKDRHRTGLVNRLSPSSRKQGDAQKQYDNDYNLYGWNEAQRLREKRIDGGEEKRYPYDSEPFSAYPDPE
jgi:hypothetical protein